MLAIFDSVFIVIWSEKNLTAEAQCNQQAQPNKIHHRDAEVAEKTIT
jgi:hypothetical protein